MHRAMAAALVAALLCLGAAAAQDAGEDNRTTLAEVEDGLDVALQTPEAGERVGTARISTESGLVAVEVQRDEVAIPEGATMVAWLWDAEAAGDEAWRQLGPLRSADGVATGGDMVGVTDLPRFDRVVVTASETPNPGPDAPGELVARGEIPPGAVVPPGGEAVEEPAVPEEPAGQQEPFAEEEPARDEPAAAAEDPGAPTPLGGVAVGALIAVVVLGALLAAAYAVSQRR